MTTDRMAAALEYAGYGWQVIPMRGPKSKAPAFKDWPKKATDDMEVIEKWWAKNPDNNVGVLFGPRSGIIDVECDSDEEEQILLDLFGGEFPDTPTFQSSRGKHRLFRWSDNLPDPGKAVFKVGTLGFRTGNGDLGAQSVFPPSLHPSGVPYKWLVHPNDADVSDVPMEVLTRLWNLLGDSPLDGNGKPAARTQDYWDQVITQGVNEGGRNDAICSVIGKALYELRDLEKTSSVALAWAVAESANEKYKPPLSEKELKKTFRSILEREKNRRFADQNGEMMHGKATDVADAPSEDFGGMKIVIYKSEPVLFQFHSPVFQRAGGFIRLTADQIKSPSKLKVQALEQSYYPMTNTFVKQFINEYCDKLMSVAEEIDAPPEEKRTSVIAMMLLDELADSHVVSEGGNPIDHNSNYMTDGSYLFMFNLVWEPMRASSDKILRSDFSRLLKKIGADTYQPHGRSKFQKIPAGSIPILQRIAEGEISFTP